MVSGLEKSWILALPLFFFFLFDVIVSLNSRRTVLDDRTATTAAAHRPPGPQPGQTPANPAVPQATAAPNTIPPHGPVLPANVNFGIWGPPGVPMTINRDVGAGAGSGSGFGIPSSSSWPPQTSSAQTQTNGAPTRNGMLSRQESANSVRNSPPAITPISSQAPDVFTLPSKSLFERSSNIPTGTETPAQLAAAAALRRLQRMNQTEPPLEMAKEPTNGPSVADPSTRSPYLVPLKPSRAEALSAVGRTQSFSLSEPAARGPGGIISSLHSDMDELHGMLVSTTTRLRDGSGGTDGDHSRRELDEHLRRLQELDRKLGDNLDEVTVALSLLSPP